jgi:hypothetical protein
MRKSVLIRLSCIFLCLALVSALLPVTALAVEPPMVASGYVFVNEVEAEDGTLVEAKIDDVVVDFCFTPAGGGDKGYYVLSIPPEVGAGHEVHFFVLGIEAEESPKTWTSGGRYLNLHIILEVPPLIITTTTLPEGKVGDVYSATLEATGGEPPYTWEVTGLPAGLGFDAAGTISGNPTEAGDFTVGVTVTDSFTPTNSDSKNLALKVYPALAVTATTLPEGKVGDPYSATLEATGGKPPYTWDVTGLPAGLSFDAAGTISGNPTEAFDDTVGVTVTDSFDPTNSDSKDLALKVYPALAVTTTTLPEGKVGDVYSATLEATGGKPPYTWDVTGLPAGLSFDAAGTISGTPTEAIDDTVGVPVTDSFTPPNSDSKDLALKVYEALAITTTSLPDGRIDNPYSATLEASGGKPPYTWDVTGLPAGLGFDAAGTISGTPTETGEFTVGVTVTDSFDPTNSDSKDLVLKVYGALIITTSLPEGKVGDEYSATLEASGGEPPYTWDVTGLPAGLSFDAAGTISGNPTEAGDFTVGVTVTDSSTPPQSDSIDLALKVYEALAITTTTLLDGRVGDPYSATLEATGGKPPYTWDVTGLPAGLSFDAAGTISGTPTDAGDFTVGVTVTDSFDPTNSDSKDLALKIYEEMAISFNIPLASGWNYISVPLIPEDSDIEVVLSSIEGKYEDVWAYEAATETWRTYKPGAPPEYYAALALIGIEQLETIVDGFGYMINMNEAAVLSGTGLEQRVGPYLPPTYSVYPSWNLVGFKTMDFNDDYIITQEDDSMRVGYYLQAMDQDSIDHQVVGDEITYLRYYDPSDGQFHELSDVDSMLVGYGYWLYSMVSGEIVPPIEPEV